MASSPEIAPRLQNDPERRIGHDLPWGGVHHSGAQIVQFGAPHAGLLWAFPCVCGVLGVGVGAGAQPLIWLARIFTSACAGTGRLESVTALPAGLRCFPKFVEAGFLRRLSHSRVGVRH
jgi:hypothetical protein